MELSLDFGKIIYLCCMKRLLQLLRNS
jgi:hypothetical protein